MPLHKATLENDIAIVSQFIITPSHLNARASEINGMTYLLLAASMNNWALVHLIIQMPYCDINRTDASGASALINPTAEDRDYRRLYLRHGLHK